jgi:hypothetical protein
MKNIFIGLLLLTGTFSFAQEAGKAGELLKNEVFKNGNRIISNFPKN